MENRYKFLSFGNVLNCCVMVVVLTFTSCNKKEEDYIFTAGKDKKMMITEYGESAEATVIPGAYNKDNVALDLDQDGAIDVLGISISDDREDFEKQTYQEISIVVINKDFVISEVDNSGEKRLVFVERTFNFDGTFPRLTDIYEIVCTELSIGELIKTPGNISYLLEGNGISSGDFTTAQNVSDTINVKIPAYETRATYEASENGDSLIGSQYFFAELCTTIPSNEEIYVPFFKQEATRKRYGWLKLKVTDNEIVFIESAIQKN